MCRHGANFATMEFTNPLYVLDAEPTDIQRAYVPRFSWTTTSVSNASSASRQNTPPSRTSSVETYGDRVYKHRLQRGGPGQSKPSVSVPQSVLPSEVLWLPQQEQQQTWRRERSKGQQQRVHHVLRPYHRLRQSRQIEQPAPETGATTTPIPPVPVPVSPRRRSRSHEIAPRIGKAHCLVCWKPQIASLRPIAHTYWGDCKLASGILPKTSTERAPAHEGSQYGSAASAQEEGLGGERPRLPLHVRLSQGDRRDPKDYLHRHTRRLPHRQLRAANRPLSREGCWRFNLSCKCSG